MKKILSIVLALAIVISCLGMITIATGTEEATFKAAKFTEVSANSATYIAGWGEKFLFSANDATFNGKVTYSYILYNVGEESIKAQLTFNNRAGNGVSSADQPQATSSTVTVAPGANAELTISINFVNGTATLNSSQGYTATLTTLCLRLNLIQISGATQPREFILVNNGCDGADYFVDTFASTPKWTKVAATEADLPVEYAGVKLEAKEDKESAYNVSDYNHSPWGVDGSFTGTKTLSYVIYNTSTKAVEVELYILGMSQSQAKSGDAETHKKVTVPAGYKGDISALVNVENGTAKLKADGSLNVTLNALRVRFMIKFTGGGATGDAIVIASDDKVSSDFIINAFTTSGATKTALTELPTLNYTPAPSQPGGDDNQGGEGDGDGGQGEVAPKYIAAKFEEKTPSDTRQYICAWGAGKFLEDDATFNGTITNKYVIYNTGETELTINAVYNNQSGENATVAGAVAADVLIAPGGYKELEISVKFVNGVAVIDESDNFTSTLAQLRVRFNYKFSAAQKGNSFIIASATDDENDYIIKTYVNDAKYVKTLLTKEQLPKIEAAKVPTGVTLTTSEEADGSGKLYFTTATGLVTDADVEDGVAVKTFKIKNNGDAAIEVKLDLQALAGGSWKSPSGSTAQYYTIEPGKTVEVECEVDCENGNVIIADEEISISKLFGKFSVKGEDGTLPAGSSFTIYYAESEAACFTDLINEKNTAHEYWTQETVFTAAGANTGDVLPVALMATVAFAAIALVVVSKKRKED